MHLKHVVLLSTADWDNPFWTNKQHMANELARLGTKVLYIESVGLRTPTLAPQDLSRMWRRLKRGLARPRRVGENIWVWSPLLIPLQRFRLVRAINRWILTVGLRLWSRALKFKDPILWTYNPMTTELLHIRAFGTLIYHCVDDIKAQPGMPAEDIERAERALVRRAEVCFVTAPELLDKLKPLNEDTYYHSNVADYNHFAKARQDATRLPADLCNIPEPRIIFVGAISSYKVDFPLLRRLALAMPTASLVLIGKIGEGDPGTSVTELAGIPNVYFLGPRSYSDLPGYLKGSAVAVLPSRLNEYTRSMFPMKFYEYLAAGLPVVSTNLPALQEHQSLAYLAKDHDEFVVAVERALAGDAAPLDARLNAAREQTYERRTQRMLTVVDEVTKRGSSAVGRPQGRVA